MESAIISLTCFVCAFALLSCQPAKLDIEKSKEAKPSQYELIEHIQFIEENVNLPPVCDNSFTSMKTKDCQENIFTSVANEELRRNKNDYVRLYYYSDTGDYANKKIKGLYIIKTEISDRQSSYPKLDTYPKIPGHQDAYLVDFDRISHNGGCRFITLLYDVETAELIPAKTREFASVDHVLEDGTIIHGQCNPHHQ